MQEELKRELAAEMEMQKKKLLMEDPTLRSEMEKLNLIKEQKRAQDEKKKEEERENEKVRGFEWVTKIYGSKVKHFY